MKNTKKKRKFYLQCLNDVNLTVKENCALVWANIDVVQFYRNSERMLMFDP